MAATNKCLAQSNKSGTGAKRLRSGTLRTALNRGIVRKVKRGLYRWHG